jgi:phosphatidate cytidylyltransferase
LTIKILSGVIGAFFIITLLLFDRNFPYFLNILVGLVGCLSVHEIFVAIKLEKNYFLILPSYFFTSLLPIVGVHETKWQFICYVYTLVVVGIMLLRNKGLKLKDVVMVYSMTVFISFALTTLIRLRDMGGKIGSFYVLLALGIAWISDTGAYFGGSFLGKQKLCPEISPKKTVEGVVSGVLFCIIIMFLISFLFEKINFDRSVISVNYVFLIMICLIGSFIAVIGDLFFSWVKRGCKIKDFGDVMPGHGGVLDRFDSVIFVAPFVYFMIKISAVLITK